MESLGCQGADSQGVGLGCGQSCKNGFPSPFPKSSL